MFESLNVLNHTHIFGMNPYQINSPYVGVYAKISQANVNGRVKPINKMANAYFVSATLFSTLKDIVYRIDIIYRIDILYRRDIL